MPLEERAISLETSDLLLLSQTNSFYRKLDDESFTKDWANLSEEANSPWQSVLPSGWLNSRWWQISKLDPDIKFGWYNLYCIEMNDSHLNYRTSARFDRFSKFKMVFANEGEINDLKKLLENPGR